MQLTEASKVDTAHNSAAKISLLQQRITDEFAKAMGFRADGGMRRVLAGIVTNPTRRFSALMSRADDAAQANGLHGASRSLVKDMGIQVNALGAEQIPPHGPALVVSNHPASYDSACILSVIPRADLRIIVYETQFYHGLEHLAPLFIMVSTDRARRFNALRAAIGHLQSGGALVTFGSGLIEPDPQAQPGIIASLADWSPSLEAMLRKVPQTAVVHCCVSGVVMPRYLRSPLTLLRSKPKDKRRLAEFLQIADMAVRGNPPENPVEITFSPPLTIADYQSMAQETLSNAVRSRQAALVEQHLQRLAAEGIPVYR